MIWPYRGRSSTYQPVFHAIHGKKSGMVWLFVGVNVTRKKPNDGSCSALKSIKHAAPLAKTGVHARKHAVAAGRQVARNHCRSPALIPREGFPCPWRTKYQAGVKQDKGKMPRIMGRPLPHEGWQGVSSARRESEYLPSRLEWVHGEKQKSRILGMVERLW